MKETLKALREQNNYSQAAVAEFLGISRQMYIKYESGESIPPVKTVIALSDFYRVSYDILLEDKLNTDKTHDEKTLYQIPEPSLLEVHDSAPAYAVTNSAQSYYLTAILEMLPKLIFREQLKVLEQISHIVQESAAEELKPKKHNTFSDALEELNNKYHPKSDGKKWSREELHER